LPRQVPAPIAAIIGPPNEQHRFNNRSRIDFATAQGSFLRNCHFPIPPRLTRLPAAFGFASFGVPSIDANASRNRLSDNGDSLGAFAGAAFFTGSDVDYLFAWARRIAPPADRSKRNRALPNRVQRHPMLTGCGLAITQTDYPLSRRPLLIRHLFLIAFRFLLRSVAFALAGAFPGFSAAFAGCGADVAAVLPPLWVESASDCDTSAPSCSFMQTFDHPLVGNEIHSVRLIIYERMDRSIRSDFC